MIQYGSLVNSTTETMSTQDFLGLDSPETNRVISISASQSLHASKSSPGAISTGLPRLDEAISPSLDVLSGRGKGVLRGHVTEVFGPPGVGKTSLALQTAANALYAGGKVVWIDTGSPLPTPRLKEMLLALTGSKAEDPDPDINTLTCNLIYFRAQSLPHLLALLLHPPKSFPPPATTLLVIDSVSGPFPSYFLNPTELRSRLERGRIADKSQLQWLLNRKWNVTGDLATQLTKLAAAHRMAVLLVNQTHTKIRGQPRPTLYPVVAGASWENSVYTRIVLYRDLPAGDMALRKMRFAEVMKRDGKPVTVRVEENVVLFLIEGAGLRQLDPTKSPSSTVSLVQDQDQDLQLPTSSPVQRKRKRKRKADEIADSQDEDEDEDEEDYGWIDDDAGLLDATE